MWRRWRKLGRRPGGEKRKGDAPTKTSSNMPPDAGDLRQDLE